VPELVIPGRLNGPPGSGNGGISAGLLAGWLPADATVEVTLRRPPPLDTQLRVECDGSAAALFDDTALVAESRVVEPAAAGAPAAVQPVGTAREAMRRFDGRTDHPFPTCFVCGTGRAAHDGLELFAGAVATNRHRVAASFEVRPSHLPPEFPAGSVLSWAALDCPGAWAIGLAGRAVVLGRITARVRRVPMLGEECVVVAELDGTEGRKAFTRSTLYSAGGEEYARASSVWIELAR
jgi:hypothetical protein